MTELIFANAFLIVGIYNLLKPKMLLGFLGHWFQKNLPGKLHKPVFMCMPCMASVYGFAFFPYDELSLLWYPVWAIVLSGIMKILSFWANL